MKSVDRILGEAMTPWQKRIHKNPEKAYYWALKYGKRFPEAEPYIAKDPGWAHSYALKVIKGRWPEAEATIAKDPEWAYWYWAYWYAIDDSRWPEAEATIARSGEAKAYLQKFPEAIHDWYLKGWLKMNPELAYFYARDVIKDRWLETEATIATDPKWSKRYLQKFPDAKADWVTNGWIDIDDYMDIGPTEDRIGL